MTTLYSQKESQVASLKPNISQILGGFPVWKYQTFNLFSGSMQHFFHTMLILTQTDSSYVNYFISAVPEEIID